MSVAVPPDDEALLLHSLFSEGPVNHGSIDVKEQQVSVVLLHHAEVAGEYHI